MNDYPADSRLVATSHEREDVPVRRFFDVTSRDPSCQARTGLLRTARGEIHTPVFMPVGTHAAVKTISSPELEALGAEVILSNAFHLYLRPGADCVAGAGGLHRFMNWNRPILTDSGGYQIFSLKDPKEITDRGIRFKSSLDGSVYFLTPQEVIKIQAQLGSDIWMPLDHCTGYPATREESEDAVRRTFEWAKQSKEACESYEGGAGILFGIVQGGVFPDLRVRALEDIVELNVPGIAVGGLSVGEPREAMREVLEALVSEMPQEKPRYLMGVGYPEDLFVAVERGMDMFDCVVPTRNGRNGTVFYSGGRLLLGNSEFRNDQRPIDENCTCFTCCHYSRSYLRHLFKAKEMLGLRLASLHNLHFFIELLKNMRRAIERGAFLHFKEDFFRTYKEKGLFV